MSKEAQQALDKMAENARELGLDYEPAQLPFGVGGGLVAIKTLLSRDPCAHANTAIQMIDAILAEQPASYKIRMDLPASISSEAIEADKLLKPQPAQQQEPVAKICHDLDGHIGWNPNLRQLPDEGVALYTSPPTLSLAQRPHECSRSHPHENMNAMCELRTEIARLTNENARLKAMHQDDEINTYRMTLLCIRDGLQQGMSKSIQKLQAREINDVLGLPSFASYRTSPPAQRTWQGLTDDEIYPLYSEPSSDAEMVEFARAIEAKLKEKNNGN